MKMLPMGGRVLVRRTETKEETAGGLHIPDVAKEKPQECIVVGTGPGVMRLDGSRREVSVKTGDRVLLGKYSGTEVRIDDVPHLIVLEDDILGIIV